MFILIRHIVVLMFLVLGSNISNAEYLVKTIYFQPTNSQDRSEWLDLDDIMKSVQDTYRDEMERHGFPNQTFRLETNQDNKVIVHKVKGDHNRAHYAGNTALILPQELERKGYNDIHTIYSVVMAGMDTVQNGAGGVALARPWGGWFGNGNSQYSGYSISTEKERDRTKQIIRHELGHVFGLWHIALYDPAEYIMGTFGFGDKLAFHEARWLSKIHYFNFEKVWHHNFAPRVTDFQGAKVFEGDKIRFKATVSDRDNDGIFQVYGFVDFNIVGWNLFNEDNATVVVDITDIDRIHLIRSNQIIFQAMDKHGNWTIDFPQSYVLPKEINKNEDLDLVVDNTEDCPGCEVDTPRPVKPERKLTVIWGSLKQRNR